MHALSGVAVSKAADLSNLPGAPDFCREAMWSAAASTENAAVKAGAEPTLEKDVPAATREDGSVRFIAFPGSLFHGPEA